MLEAIRYEYPQVAPGAFIYGAVGLDHAHIYGMCAGLNQAGASLKWVFDPDAAKVAAFQRQFPESRSARCEAEVLDDPALALVAGAPVPGERYALGLRTMASGKDFFSDKAPFTALSQLAQVRTSCEITGRKYFVYYSERLHVECAILAGQLVAQGAIGRVINILGSAPHRLNAAERPDWFFRTAPTGGILCDLGSHQLEQFLFFSGGTDGTIQYSRVANYHHRDYPEFQDFGDVMAVADNGCTGYFRVDWFTPHGLNTWGDGRLFLTGTEGTLELRKNTDVAQSATPDHLYLVNREGEFHLEASGQTGYPFFGQLIQDCIHRTETAMTQSHAFKAAELSLMAQDQAVKIDTSA